MTTCHFLKYQMNMGLSEALMGTIIVTNLTEFYPVINIFLTSQW
jgi:hypothetical protein